MFSFVQCGIILGSLVLYLNSLMTKLCCHQLIKASLIARRRNYEVLGRSCFQFFCVSCSIHFHFCSIWCYGTIRQTMGWSLYNWLPYGLLYSLSCRLGRPGTWNIGYTGLRLFSLLVKNIPDDNSESLGNFTTEFVAWHREFEPDVYRISSHLFTSGTKGNINI